MKIFKLILVIFIVALFTGCGAHGPMESHRGPINTPVFKPVVLDTLKDGSNDILFQESGVMYLEHDFQSFGDLIITNKGVYFLKWNTYSYTYGTPYQVDFKDIVQITDDTIHRTIGFDSNLLVIEDNRGSKVGFWIQQITAAKNRILNFIENKYSKD